MDDRKKIIEKRTGVKNPYYGKLSDGGKVLMKEMIEPYMVLREIKSNTLYINKSNIPFWFNSKRYLHMYRMRTKNNQVELLDLYLDTNNKIVIKNKVATFNNVVSLYNYMLRNVHKPTQDELQTSPKAQYKSDCYKIFFNLLESCKDTFPDVSKLDTWWGMVNC